MALEGQAESPSGFSLFGIYVSPSQALGGVARNPRWLVPLLGLVVLNLLFTAAWTQKVDPVEFFRAQAESSARFAKLTPEQQESALHTQSKIFVPIAWASAVLGPPIVVSIVSLVIVFVFRFVLGDETTLRQGYAIVSWTFFAVSLVQMPLILLTLFLKDDWTLVPQEAFQTGASLFVDKQAVSKALFAFLGSLDLFSFWTIFLLACGFAAASKRRLGAALVGIVVPWVLYVAGKATLTWLTS